MATPCLIVECRQIMRQLVKVSREEESSETNLIYNHYQQAYDTKSKLLHSLLMDESVTVDALDVMKFMHTDLRYSLDDDLSKQDLLRLLKRTISILHATYKRCEAQATKSVRKTQTFHIKNPRPRGKSPTGKKWNYVTGEWVNPADVSGACLIKPIAKHPRPRGKNRAGSLGWDYDRGVWIYPAILDTDKSSEGANMPPITAQKIDIADAGDPDACDRMNTNQETEENDESAKEVPIVDSASEGKQNDSEAESDVDESDDDDECDAGDMDDMGGF